MSGRSIGQEQPGKTLSLILTIAVHFGLVAFLFFGIRWQNQPPASLEVELVGPDRQARTTPAPAPTRQPRPRPTQPQPAPPQVQTPPPPPPTPEIATRPPVTPPPATQPRQPPPTATPPQRPPALTPPPRQPQPRPTPPRPAPRDDDYITKLLNDQLQKDDAARAEEILRGNSAQSSAPRNAGELDAYKNAIRAKVRGKLLPPLGITGNPEATFEVDQLPGGDVLDIRLVRSSGNGALDAAIERAIRSASPLPLPANPKLFERTLELTFRPLGE